MRRTSCTILLAAFLGMPVGYAQTTTTPIQQASAQFRTAEKAEAALYEKPAAVRTREDYLKVIRSYERVYLITPKTGWADNALTSIARLYEEIKDSKNAIKTLQFLLHEYPQTPLQDVAEQDIARLTGGVEVVVSKEDATVENIRFWQESDAVRVVIDITGAVNTKVGEAKSPDRYFVDVSRARLNSMLIGKEWDIDASGVKKIRVAQYDGSTVRVVLDGATLRNVTLSSLKDPSRLILDVAANGSVAPAKPPAITTLTTAPAATPPGSAPAPPATASNPVLQPSAVLTDAAGRPASTPVISAPTNIAANSGATISATPGAGTSADSTRVVTEARPTNAGSRSLIRSLGLKLSRVVIDAGHGGHDTGSLGPSGYTEKELVLDVARRLKELIEKEMETEVVMTRSEDEFVPLESRTQIANKENADLFVSIHANSSQTKSVRGVETFFLNFNTQSREALTTASRENAASELGIHELQDLVKKIMLNDKVDESRELAQHIQSAMSKRLNASNRGVKQAPFVVLIGANMPSILAEVSFISNPDEEKKLKTPTYRQQIAESLYQGIKSYAETLSSMKTAGASAEKAP